MLSSVAMRTTARVGHPEEDATMAQMRAQLARLNAAGLVTTDSQMGRDNKWKYKEKSGRKLQRAYVCGFATRETVDRLVEALTVAGEAFVFSEKFPKRDLKDQARPVSSVRVTRTLRDGRTTWTNETAIPTCAPLFSDEWMNLLPELDLASDNGARRAVERDAVYFAAVDMTWGRPKWLFNKLEKAFARST